jgi:hypothetical protein
VGCIVCRNGFSRWAAERGLGRFCKLSERFKGYRVWTLSELCPDPAPPFLMLVVELLDLVAGLGMRERESGFEFLAKPVLLLFVESRPAGMIGEAK